MRKMSLGALTAVLLAGLGFAQGGPPQPTLTQAVDAAIAAAAADVAGDPAKARAAVAARVETEAYEGVLKGPRGAWLTQAANSADQALLVADLLGAGAAKRFAWCDLAAPPEVKARPFTSLFDKPGELEAAFADPVLKQRVRDFVALRKAKLAEAASYRGDLEAALGETGVAAPAASPAPTRHVWLQVENGGAWSDVDPTTPTGTSPCTAAETAESLPRDMEVRVRFAVEVETTPVEGPNVAEAFSLDVGVAEIATARIAFAFAETIEADTKRAKDTVGLQDYTPVLMIDGDATAGAPLKLLAPGAAIAGSLGDAASAFDEPENAADETQVTAMTLVIQLTGPGIDTKELRSTIFDRIGPAARVNGYDPATQIQKLDIADGDYAALSTVWQIGLLTGIADPRIILKLAFDDTTSAGVSGQLDVLLRSYPGFRRDLGGATSVPVVLLAGLSPAARDDGRTVTRLIFDALYVPGGASPADAAADGAITLAAERLLGAAVSGDEAPLSSAAQVFDAARAASIPLVALKPGETADSLSGLSADALMRVNRRLADGYGALTPQFAPTVDGVTATAWWLIDPATGAIRDEHESGRHAVIPERGKLTCESVGWAAKYRRISNAINIVMIAGAALLAASGDMAAAKDLAETVQEADDKKKKAAEAAEAACGGGK